MTTLLDEVRRLHHYALKLEAEVETLRRVRTTHLKYIEELKDEIDRLHAGTEITPCGHVLDEASRYHDAEREIERLREENAKLRELLSECTGAVDDIDERLNYVSVQIDRSTLEEARKRLEEKP
jgi:chromosome segregation ATPase